MLGYPVCNYVEEQVRFKTTKIVEVQIVADT